MDEAKEQISRTVVMNMMRSQRLNQPRATLQQAQKQAERVMEAARHSPLRSRPFSIGAKAQV